MGENRPTTAPLALLIDGDNTSPKIVEGLLKEIANYGVAFVRRIYGDWTKPNLGQWKDCLLEHSIQPIQQFAYTKGKNATDGAMIIDAMDLLHTGRFSGFCIVSSDSDFARLAARIREQGVTVYGFGERKSPQPFITACDKFVYLDTLSPQKPTPIKVTAAAQPLPKPRLTKAALNILAEAITASANEDGHADLAVVGSTLSKHSPGFARSHGYARLSDLVNNTDTVTVLRTPDNPKTIKVRLKTSPTRISG